MTIAEMIKVMLAYERGEQIEYKEKKDSEWLPLFHDPYWDWVQFEYRIKPKHIFRPYESAEEFLQAQKEHGMYIRPKDSTSRYELPTSVDDEKVVFILPTNTSNAYAVCYHYDNLLKDKVWQDGTPCGVEEE